MQLPSRTDLLEIGRQFVLARAKRIEPTQVDVAGSDINLFVGSTSYIGHHLVRQLAEQVTALLLGGCDTEDAIDRLAFDRYQELRKGAAPALGTVTFSRPTATAGSGSVPAGTKVLTLSGIEYFTTGVANFGALTLEASVNVSAAKAGKDFQAGANSIRRIDPQALQQLWDPTLTVNNPAACAGGEPAETIDAFRERLRRFFIGARRGTLSAIEFGATQVPGVDSSQAVETFDADGTAARLVRLFIADSSGIASRALADKVLLALNEYRGGGITVIVDTGAPTLVSLTLALRFLTIAGTTPDTVTLRDQVRGACVEFINSLGVNRPLLLSDLMAVLARFRGDGLLVTSDTIVSPTGDLYPEAGRSLRTTTASVTLVE